MSKGADGAAVDSLPLGADTNVVEFYVNGKRLRLFGQDGAEITASFDGDQEIKFDDGGLIATTAIANLEYDEDYSNIGFEERRLRSVLSNGYNTNASFELYMPIRRVFKFLETHTIPIKGSSHIIELNKADASEYLFSEALANMVPANVEAEVKLLRLSLWVPKLRFSLPIENLYLSKLGTQVVPFVWDSYQWNRTQNRSEASGSWDVSTVSGIPRRMYVVFQNATRVNEQTQNNMVFDNLNLDEIYVRLNSVKFPEYPYEIDFGVTDALEEDYGRVYNAYLKACRADHSEDCVPAVSYREFKELYPIFCFDMTAQTESIFKNNSNIQIKVHYRLKTKPAADYRIMAVFEEEVRTDIEFISGSVVKIR